MLEQHDGLLLDLDGTLYRGSTAIEGAVELLECIGPRRVLMTNNASRSPGEVAQHMRDMDFVIDPDAIVTSGQTAARMLRDRLESHSRVLVIGTEALAAEVADVDLVPVRSQMDAPVAVVQGHSPETDWKCLAEGALAIRSGAIWLACNADATFPTERGLVPGNGSMVAALRLATQSEPVVVGKPASYMLREGLNRGRFTSPLVVGDRLDTDIAGAAAARLPSLVVLTGVSRPRDVVYAPKDCRPTFIAESIRGLRQTAKSLRIAPQQAWHTSVDATSVRVESSNDFTDPDDLSVVRAVAQAVWRMRGDGSHPRIVAADPRGRRALKRWGLLDE